jgi:EAL domain-containing protein (putative c-di-GMP-specific phosphodiesterase class I)
MEVVAEGVEDLAVAELLAARGCDQIQGYLYSKPLPAAEFIEWWKAFEPAAVRA